MYFSETIQYDKLSEGFGSIKIFTIQYQYFLNGTISWQYFKQNCMTLRNPILLNLALYASEILLINSELPSCGDVLLAIESNLKIFV